MSEEKIRFVSRFIDGYTGYEEGWEDIKRVNLYIRDRIVRMNSVVARLAAVVPPDVSSYFTMASKISGEVLSLISIEYRDVDIEDSVAEKLVEIDYKVVEILNTIVKILDSLVGGLSLPMSREYGVMIYRLTGKLKNLLDMRLKLLGLERYNKG